MTAESDGGAKSSIHAVLFLDLVNSSRLMGERERETIAFLDRCITLFRELGGEYGGELVKETGDGALLVFPTATAAISCTIQIQRDIAGLTGSLGGLAAFRAGIHVGEIIRSHGDVFGNVVNIASRLEGIADPGGICVSHEVYRLASPQTDVIFETLGRRRLKNITGTMNVYRVVAGNPGERPVGPLPVFIRTIGGLSLSRDAEKVAIPEGDKERGVLAFLAASPDGSELVGSLAAALWPDQQIGKAERLINSAVEKLDSTVPVILHDEAVHLDRDRTTVDLHLIDSELRRGKIDPLLNRVNDWPEKILYGYDALGSLFASWIAVTRNDWRTRVCETLEKCLDRFDVIDEGTRDAAMALVRLEPAHERAARALIRHYNAVDNPGAARRVFEQLKEYLAANLGLEPKSETRVALKGDPAPGDRLSRTYRKPLRIQLADFKSDTNSGGELAVSLRNELIASLAAFRGWSVVEVEQPADSGREFGDYRLAGMYRELEGVIDLALVEPATGRTVWVESLSLDSDSFQTTKASVIGNIAATLEVYISTDRINSAKRDDTKIDVDAWLRGERLFTRWTAEDHDSAADTFQRLIDQQPEFAPPYASLASLYNVRHIVRPGVSRDAFASHRAYQLADRAAELDPLDARNQLAIAWSASLEGDFDKAGLHMNMAARLNPNSPRTTVSCAMGFAFFGDHVRAGQLLEHSLQCAPLLLDYQWCYAAAVYYLAGDYQAALTAAKRGHDRIIDNPGWHAAALMKLGDAEAASIEFGKLVSSVSANWHQNRKASPQAVYEWFLDIYPFRRSEEREVLADALSPIVES